MYTTVFYKEGTNELVATQESNTKPRVKKSNHPYYVQEGEFDGVVDPSKHVDNRTETEILREENETLKERLQSTENAFFQFMMSESNSTFF